MRQKSNSTPASSETLVRNIRRATRKHHAAEEKIRIVLDGLRGETSIAELCRREGIAESRRARQWRRTRSSFSPKLLSALELASDRQIRRNASQVGEHSADYASLPRRRLRSATDTRHRGAACVASETLR
jgi:transposase-like protein